MILIVSTAVNCQIPLSTLFGIEIPFGIGKVPIHHALNPINEYHRPAYHKGPQLCACPCSDEVVVSREDCGNSREKKDFMDIYDDIELVEKGAQGPLFENRTKAIEEMEELPLVDDLLKNLINLDSYESLNFMKHFEEKFGKDKRSDLEHIVEKRDEDAFAIFMDAMMVDDYAKVGIDPKAFIINIEPIFFQFTRLVADSLTDIDEEDVGNDLKKGKLNMPWLI